MKVYVDPDLCIGCGMCTELAPEVFRMGDGGQAEAVAQPAPDGEEKTRNAAESCPVLAIRTEE